jgi:hypothetical protein
MFALLIKIADENRAETDVAQANADWQSLRKIVDDSDSCFLVYPDPDDRFGLGFSMILAKDPSCTPDYRKIKPAEAIHCRSKAQAVWLYWMLGKFN